MNEKMNELFDIVNANAEMMDTNRMTTDEILENIHCGVDEEGEIIDLDTGKLTGIWYEEVEY
jgi:precorrin-4 methylase